MRCNILRFGALLPVLLAAAFAACNDNPTTIGSEYLPQNVEFSSYTLKPEDYEILSGIAAVANSSAQGALGLGIGQAPDGTVAHGLLAITSESPILSGSAAQPVKQASLVLHPLSYRYGDTIGQLSFDVVVLDEVFPIAAKWDDALVSRMEGAPSLGTFTGAYPATQADSLVVTLDPAATQTFLQEYFRYDSSSNGREFRTLKTLALRARSDGRIIGSFFGLLGVADTLRPTLLVTTTSDTTIRLAAGTSNWIVKSSVETGRDRFVVMGGLPIRSLIRLRLDSIPADATIHQAELRLYIDNEHTFHGTYGESTYLVAYIATDTTFQQSSYLTSDISGIIPVNRPALDSATFTDMFRFTALGPTIGAWLRNRRGDGMLENQGLILAYYRGTSSPDLETTTVDRLTFFGPDAADPAVRPALTITYSVQVDANK